METAVIPRHPARFSRSIVEAVGDLLRTYAPDESLTILDPFAGVGGVHALADDGHVTVGIELQPEWAIADSRTLVGDATSLPFDDDSFDAVVTSPAYGNRLADHHNARDDTRRNTYTHALRESGVEPMTGSSATMQWGHEYRELHKRAWAETMRVLRPGALVVLNVSNHIRRGVEQPVVEWHTYQFIGRRCLLLEARRVPTQRNGFGENRDARVDGEMILVFRAPL